MNNEPVETPIEDLRLQALIHYDEASSAIHHYSSFVKNAILAYNPKSVEPASTEQEDNSDQTAK